MGIGTLGPNDRSKIMALVNSGIDVLREIATLKEGLKDQVGAVSEELDIDTRGEEGRTSVSVSIERHRAWND